MSTKNTVIAEPKSANFTESMNMKFGEVENAHVMTNVNMGFSAYGTLCLICAKLDIDLSDVDDDDFSSAADCLESFVNSANTETGYTVSVWFTTDI